MNKIKEILKVAWKFVSYLFWPQINHRKEQANKEL